MSHFSGFLHFTLHAPKNENIMGYQCLILTNTDLCHGLHFYADVLLKLAGTDIARKNQGHIVRIHKLQESCTLSVVAWRLLELVSCQFHLRKQRIFVFSLVVHCRHNFEVKIRRPLGFAAYSSNASLKKGTYIILYGNDGVHRTVTIILKYQSVFNYGTKHYQDLD